MAVVQFDRATKDFIVTDSRGESQRFEYKPELRDCWTNTDDFELHILQHHEPRKESDISCVYLDDDAENSVGWIFPLSIIDTDTIEPKGKLLDYVFITFQKILEEMDSVAEKYEVSDVLTVYNEDAIALILNRRHLSPIFNIERYRYSLYENGFSIGERVPVRIPYYQYNQASHIQLISSECDSADLPNSAYVDEIIKHDLLETSNPIHRFLILYQIIEILMDNMAESAVLEGIDAYNKGSLGKKDLMIIIDNATKESENIQSIFNGLSVHPYLNKAYIEAVKALYKKVEYMDKHTDLASCVYSLRNQLFHSYRRYVGEKELLYATIQSFEKIILNLLIHYQKKVEE